MNYIRKNNLYHYWAIRLVPINDKGYGTPWNYIAKGFSIDNAIKNAEKECHKTIKTYGFQIYGIEKVLYECDYWGRKIL